MAAAEEGVADRWIYYDPKVAAVFLFDEEKYEGSSRDYTYYMDALGRMDEGGRTYKEMIGRKRLMYVHEVQHWLRKKDKREDGLEINEGKE